jgi:hypothetical protein
MQRSITSSYYFLALLITGCYGLVKSEAGEESAGSGQYRNREEVSMNDLLADRLEKAIAPFANGAPFKGKVGLVFALASEVIDNADVLLASLRRPAPASGEMGETPNLAVGVRVSITGTIVDVTPAGWEYFVKIDNDERGERVFEAAAMTALRTPSDETGEEAGP